MSSRLKKVLIWIMYPVFYLVCFLLFAYLSFPFEHLRDRIIVGFAEDQRKTGGASRLEIDEISSYWLSGVEASGVRMITPASTSFDGTTKPASEIEIDHLTVRAKILSLLFGNLKLSFAAEMLGGSLQGMTARSDTERTIELEFKDLSIGQFDPIVAVLGVPLGGELNGTVELAIPEGKLSKAGGAVNLVIRNFTITDEKTKIKNMIAMPKIAVGDLELEAEITEGTMKIKKLAAAGGDLDLSAEGKINLRDPIAESQSDLQLKFRFSDKYRNKDDNTRSLLGAPGSAGLIETFEPKMKQAKRQDGFYGFRAWGLLSKIRFDASPAGAPAGAGSARGGVRGFGR